jgi:hypothetical protein
VIQHATEHNRAPMGFGTAHGHRSMYDAHAPFIPNPSPTVNPRARPGISQAMRYAEDERQRERPLGELTPATGRKKRRWATIQGRRQF